jgi:glycosyltransferase EpsE
MPSITVIIVVYNGENSITKAVDSIVQQSFKDWELIVCDDASSDNTYNLLENYVTDERIKIIQNEKNRGCGASRNKCIENATGKYLVIQDADDHSYPNRLQVLYDAISASNETVVISSCADLINTNGNVWGEYVIDDPVEKNWVKGSQIIGAAVIMDKGAILAVNSYDSKAIRGEDYDLFVRLVTCKYKIGVIKDRLYAIHWDREDYSRKKLKDRLNEIPVAFRAFLLPGCPWYYFPYVLKSIIVGLLPKGLLLRIHRKRFTTPPKE